MNTIRLDPMMERQQAVIIIVDMISIFPKIYIYYSSWRTEFVLLRGRDVEKLLSGGAEMPCPRKLLALCSVLHLIGTREGLLVVSIILH
jgi:hypothetical protein